MSARLSARMSRLERITGVSTCLVCKGLGGGFVVRFEGDDSPLPQCDHCGRGPSCFIRFRVAENRPVESPGVARSVLPDSPNGP